MYKEGDEVHVDEVEASGGSKEGVVRWVLAGGLILAILLMSIVWIIPALSEGDVEEEATMSGELQSMEEEGDGTDSIVGVPSETDLGNDEDGRPMIVMKRVEGTAWTEHLRRPATLDDAWLAEHVEILIEVLETNLRV